MASEQAYDAVSSTLDGLLEELAEEPDNEEDSKAKFLLYEGFAKTIEAIRDCTIQFWNEYKDQFTGVSQASCEHDIRGIDSEENLSILDDLGKWFVYSMAKRANKNAKMINNVLSSLRVRLQLLEQTEVTCPMCLEDNIPVGNQQLLGCCHKTCKPCWENWIEMKGPGGAFCPLCRHQDFLADIVEQASG
jgi:hypothetical protein